MAEINLPSEDQMREALYGAKKPTEWRRVIKLPEGTVVRSYDINGDVEVSVPTEYDVRIIGPGHPETTYTKATDYRDGQWHGWNGGACSVNLNDEIQAVYFDGALNFVDIDDGLAGHFDWSGLLSRVIAFRAVSRKPREYTDDDGVTWREVTE